MHRGGLIAASRGDIMGLEICMLNALWRVTAYEIQSPTLEAVYHAGAPTVLFRKAALWRVSSIEAEPEVRGRRGGR